MNRGQGNLILCGFMGCGKTSVGRRAARLLEREFCDLDQYIEEKAGSQRFSPSLGKRAFGSGRSRLCGKWQPGLD